MADKGAMSARRSFLARLGAGLGVVGAGLAAGVEVASGQTKGGGGAFQPARHTPDDWLDELPGKHRLVFDTTSTDSVAMTLLYANNFFVGNQNGYGLGDADTAVVIVVRHNSTPFAYNDSIWAKYGATIAARTSLVDPKTKQPPTINLLNSTAPGLPNLGITIDSLLKRGVHFAVCQLATRRVAGQIAQASGGNVDAVYSELAANLVGNAHLAASGIVAFSRAQEHGYTAATALP